MFDEVIFDLETKTFFDGDNSDPAKLGVSIVSLYSRKVDKNLKEIQGQMLSFWEEEFEKMWPYFFAADRIIGFNSLAFDVPALKNYAPAGFSRLPHFDILKIIREASGRRTSLHRLAKACLGLQKTDLGENAITYWQRHDKKSLELLQKYCQDDVAITTQIYDFGLKNKILKFTDFWNNPREVKVDFSYTENEDNSPQQTLF